MTPTTPTPPMPTAPDLPLHPNQLPDPIPWWPPAPGWWMLLGLVLGVLLLVALGVRLVRQHRRRYGVRNLTREMIRRIAADHAAHGDDARLAREVSVLLRRVCLTRYDRTKVAALTGEAWLTFLERPLADTPHAHAFTQGPGRVLIEAPYNPQAKVDARALIRLVELWAERQR